MLRASHPQDDRLFDCYWTARHGESPDPRTAEHLADCATCAARYAELTAFMETINVEAATESDAVFTAERLRTQQQQILRRIEHLGRPARVISFPRHPAIEQPHPAIAGAPFRWTAGAAAAGLLIGVAVGASFGWQHHSRQEVVALANVKPDRPAVVGAVQAPPTANMELVRPADTDDAFLSDLETILERTNTRELGAIDELTPHVREVSEVRYVR